MSFIQELLEEMDQKIHATELWFDLVVGLEAEKLINKTIKLLPTKQADPNKVDKTMVKGIAYDKNYYGKPIFVIITDNNARIPVFSHNKVLKLTA